LLLVGNRRLINQSINQYASQRKQQHRQQQADTFAAFWELNFAESSISDAGNDNDTKVKSSNHNKDNALNAWLQKNIQQAATASQITEPAAHPILLQNLIRAVQALRVVELEIDPAQQDNDQEDDDSANKCKIKRYLQDPYKIWFQAESAATDDSNNNNGLIRWDKEQTDIPDSDGGKLALLSIGGLLNGLASLPVTKTPHSNPKTLFKQAVASGVANQLTGEVFVDCTQVTVLTLHETAIALHRAIAQHVQDDILHTTPLRIQMLLVGEELSTTEFERIRKRVYDTVILGKGRRVDAVNEEDLPAVANTVTSTLAVHAIEKFKKCGTCGYLL